MHHLYEFQSNAEGPLVNLAYANGFPPQTYTRALQPLFADYHVVSLQMRPLWGNCPPESLHSWRQLGADLIEQLDELAPGVPIIGIGHSFGAIATLYAANMRPERFSHLILIEPVLLPRLYVFGIALMRLLGREPLKPFVDQALRRARSWPDLGDAYLYFRSKRLFARWSDEQVWTYAESITQPDGKGGLTLSYPPEWEARIYQTADSSGWHLVRPIKQPILVIRGGRTDIFVGTSARRMARIKPSGQVVTIPTAGHLVPQEQPEEVGRWIRNFLSTGRA